MTQLKILLAVCLLLPLAVEAKIKFTITNVKNSTHEGHVVRAPVIIDDLSNDENVVAIGYPNNLIDGLLDDQEKSITWDSGYIFRQNISGLYSIFAGCNLDGHIFSFPKFFPQTFIPDNTDVDIKINCNVVNDSALPAPEVTITFARKD